MSAIDNLVENNRSYVPSHGHRVLPTEPALRLAVLTCMDSRLDLFGALDLSLGEAHLVRNAGGIATDDAIRSLLLSQWLLGTHSVMVIHHTRCGLETFDEETLVDEIAEELRVRPPFRLGAYHDVDEDVRQTVRTLRESPFLSDSEIRGFVYDVDDGELREITVPYSNFLKP
ncbi:MAG TPA: carbonic anhydrase [Acidimicrobiales bacterium]